MTQITIWRRQAAERLGELIVKIQGESAEVQDGLVDDLIRTLNSLPARPATRKPYEGIFPGVDTATGRQKASEMLQALILKIPTDTDHPNDALVDDLLRSLSNLPPRPAERQPYAGIFPETKILQVTAQQLLAIAPFANPTQIEKLTPHINQTMEEFGITTRLRQAHFLAQIAHESGSFNYLEEIASGDDYEGWTELGNTQPGDGRRFKGRGLIQITGRANYKDCGTALGVDLIANPTRLSDYDLAARSAGWYWDTRKLNGDADQDDVRTVTKIINGGFNGLEDRIHFLQAAKKVFGI
ncbi:MAG: glycoside hydrolase family 19 protein [Leptolyngbyaceae bacterium]|nr:glycoside hydrolase family 19 protein [Leptolyngbyaceae bacterium]